jgi:hypothetical protein
MPEKKAMSKRAGSKKIPSSKMEIIWYSPKIQF